MAPLFSRLKTLLSRDVIISCLTARDVRFPTSACGTGHGSDALHKDPNYSAAYTVLTATSSNNEGRNIYRDLILYYMYKNKTKDYNSVGGGY